MNMKSMFLSWLRNKRHTFPGVLCLIVLMISGSGAFASTITGLDFPGSKGTSVRFRFLNPLAIYPATYIWRARPRAQPADWPTSSQYFYTTFFWSNDVAGSGVGPTDGSINNSLFLWDGGSANTYYGAHPYPQGTPDGGNPPNYGAPFTASTVKWEIATDGFDWTSQQSVGFDQWYTQAFVAWADENGFKHTAFYWDLSDPTRVITHTTYPSYGNTMPPVPTLTFGDAPWHQGWEVYNGVLRGIRVYSTNLSLSDIQSEADAPLSTAAGKANIWYMNMNPTPDDILDKSGAGHNPSWVDTPASLWSGTDEPPSNTPVGNPTVQLTDASGTPISVSFTNVTQAGLTSVAAGSAPSLPPNFNLIGSYDIHTTAAFTGPVTVCINVSVDPATVQLLHSVNGSLDQSFETVAQSNRICGTVASLSTFAVVQPQYAANVQQPISAAGTSVFNGNRGVVPVKFTLSLNAAPTCQLPPATIAIFRTGGSAPAAVNQSDFLAPSDNGSNFRVDSTNCQYIYNLNSRSIGVGAYSVQVRIGGIAVGTASFALQ
jgi:hypothetical protein